MTMPGLAIKGDCIKITGPLTFATVSRLYEESSHAYTGQERLLVNLSEVTEADTAGLALLTNWIGFAKSHKISISFSNIPQVINDLAEVSGLTHLIKENTEHDTR